MAHSEKALPTPLKRERAAEAGRGARDADGRATALLRASAVAAPIVLLSLCGFVFASRIMIAKTALTAGAQPFQLAVFGSLGAGLLLLPWAVVSGQAIPCGRRHLLLYLALGLISFAIPTVLSYAVVERVGPAYAATVYSLSPLLTMAFAAGLGVERMSLRRFIGVAVGFCGMATLVWRHVAHIDMDRPIWVLFGLAIPACAAAGNVVRTMYWPKGTSALAFSCGALISPFQAASPGPPAPK